MSTPVFVDPEISTQADGAQSSRVPVPLPEDPYEASRQAYSLHIVASPTSLSDSTPPTFHVEESEGYDMSGARSMSSDSTAPLSPDHPLTHTTPTLVPVLRWIVRMVVRVLLAMSPGLSASVAEVSAMSDSTFCKRFRSSYESSPSSSPPDLPSQKRYVGTSELVEDDDKDGDDKEENEEMEESSDFDSVSEDVKDEDPTVEDEDPAAEDDDPAAGTRVLLRGTRSLRGAPVAKTAVGEPLGLGYGALRRRVIALGEGRMPSVFVDGIVYIDVPAYPPLTPPAQTPPSPEWSSGSLPISPAPSIVPSPISSPMIPLTIPSHVASPATAETKGFLTELGAQVRAVRGMRFSPRGQTNAQRAALWHAISDTQGENQELRLQLAEERRAQLKLAEIVDSIRRRQEPRGDV
ncbi:hypothetical protein Tco_0617327 [Tanacetum coccineum]